MSIARVSPISGFINITADEIAVSMLDQMDSGYAPEIETLFFEGDFEIQLSSIPAAEIKLIQGQRDGNFIEFDIGDETDPRDVYLDTTTSKLVFTPDKSPDAYTSYKVWYTYEITSSSLKTRSPGSIFRTLIQAIAKEIENVYLLILDVYNSGLVDYATGLSLDWLCAVTLGNNETYPDGTPTPRLQPTRSNGYARFYGNAGDMISSNTIIQTNETVPVSFEMADKTSDVLIPDGSEYIDILFQCTQTGSIGNQPTGTVSVIQNLGTVSDGVIVTNPQPFDHGSDLESDEDLRTRAKNAIFQSGRGTRDAIKYAVLALPSIEDCWVVDVSVSDKVEEGTVVVNVVGETLPIDESGQLWIGKYDPSVPSSYNGVIETVKNYKSAGIKAVVGQPYLVYVDILGRLMVDTLSREFNAVKTEVEAEIQSYFDSLGVGTDIKYSDIVKRVMNINGVDDFIIDLYRWSDASNLGKGQYDLRPPRSNAYSQNWWVDNTQTEGLRIGRDAGDWQAGGAGDILVYEYNAGWNQLDPTDSVNAASTHLLIGTKASSNKPDFGHIQIDVGGNIPSAGTLSKSDFAAWNGSAWQEISGSNFVDTTVSGGVSLAQDGSFIFDLQESMNQFSDTVTAGYYIRIDISGLTFGSGITLTNVGIEQQKLAQVFEASSNKLYGIYLSGDWKTQSSAPAFDVEVWSVTGNVPNAQVGSETIDIDPADPENDDHYLKYRLWFTNPVELTVGTQYAIVVEPASNDWDDYITIPLTWDETVTDADCDACYLNSNIFSGAWKQIPDIDFSLAITMRPLYKMAQSFVCGTRVIQDEIRTVDEANDELIPAVASTKTPCRTRTDGGILAVYEAEDLDGDDIAESKSVTNPENYGIQSDPPDCEINEDSGAIAIDNAVDPSLLIGQNVVVSYEQYNITDIAGVRVFLKLYFEACYGQALDIFDKITLRIETDSSGEPSGTIICGNPVGYCIKDEGGVLNEVTGWINVDEDDKEVDWTIANDNIIYFGDDYKFSAIKTKLETGAENNDSVIVWEYYDGSSWTEATFVSDSTLDTTQPLQQNGYLQLLEVPEDWTATDVYGRTAYWIRAKVTTKNTTDTISFEQVWLGFAQVSLKVSEMNLPDGYIDTDTDFYDMSAPADVNFLFETPAMLGDAGFAGTAPDYREKLWIVIQPEIMAGIAVFKADTTGTHYLSGQLKEFLDNWSDYSGERLIGVIAEEVTGESGNDYIVVEHQASMVEDDSPKNPFVIAISEEENIIFATDDLYGGTFDENQIDLDRTLSTDVTLYVTYAYDGYINIESAVDLLFVVLIEQRTNPPSTSQQANMNVIIDDKEYQAEHAVAGEITITEM